MALPETRRTQLDGIVNQMIQNKESDSDIQTVVSDFVSKYQTESVQQPAKKDLLQKVSGVVNSAFRGKQVGEAIGTLGGLGIEKAKGLLGGQDNSSNYDISAPSPLRVVADVASGALSVAGLKLPIAGTLLGKTAQFAALGGSASGARKFAEGGGVEESLKSAGTGALIGGAVGLGTGLAEKGLTKLSDLLRNRGDKIQFSVIKPSHADIKDGFSIDTLKKYKLGGSIKDTFEKTDKTLDSLGLELNRKLGSVSPKVSEDIGGHFNEARDIINNSSASHLNSLGGVRELIKRTKTNIVGGLSDHGEKEVSKIVSGIDPSKFNSLDDFQEAVFNATRGKTGAIDLNNVYEKTARRLLGNKLESFGSNSQMDGAVEKLRNEIVTVSGKNGLVSIPEAQVVKRASGHFGAWTYGVPTPEATASQKVYNTFYNELKSEIERSSPEGVREINKQISELIPIMNAVIRRIPVAERNSALSLTDIITLTGATMDPKALGLTLLNLASKSGKVGSALSRTPDFGKGLQRVEPLIRSAITR